MKFSIVIPVYNANESVISTIQSCFAQTFQDFEIIVVNDASTDGSIETIITHFGNKKIKIINLEQNGGVSNARNKGWDMAQGDYVAFLDSDDIWHQDKLLVINNALKNNNLICIAHLYTDKDAQLGYNISNLVTLKIGFWKLLFRNYFNTSCIIVKREIDLRFKKQMRYTEDHELLVRLSSIAPITMLKATLTLLGRPQLSEGGLSGNKWEMRKGEMNMYLSAASYKPIIYPALPLLAIYSLLKHLIKIWR